MLIRQAVWQWKPRRRRQQESHGRGAAGSFHLPQGLRPPPRREVEGLWRVVAFPDKDVGKGADRRGGLGAEQAVPSQAPSLHRQRQAVWVGKGWATAMDLLQPR